MDYDALLNELGKLDPKRKKNPSNYHDIQESRQELLNAAPWRRDPDYFQNVQISSLALLRMTMHARSGGTNEVMGVMTGKIQDRTFIVLDAYPLPVEATETRVNAMGEAYEYMVQYLDSLDKVGRSESLVGWYHSHPAYGCWLSRIDVDTQKQNQQFQDPFLAIVIDPNASVANGQVEIGAFRTYPDGQASRAKTRVEATTIGEYGLYAKDYYPLNVSYFRTSLDEPLFDLVWSKYWSSLLAENRLTVEQELNLQKTQQIVDMLVNGVNAPQPTPATTVLSEIPFGIVNQQQRQQQRRQPAIRAHSTTQFKKVLEAFFTRVQADVGALVALKIRNAVFSGADPLGHHLVEKNQEGIDLEIESKQVSSDENTDEAGDISDEDKATAAHAS